MTRVSTKFQHETVDFGVVKPHIASTCESLKDLLEVDGVFVEKLSKFVCLQDDKALYCRPTSESEYKKVKEQILRALLSVGIPFRTSQSRVCRKPVLSLDF